MEGCLLMSLLEWEMVNGNGREWRLGSRRYSASWLPVPPCDVAAPHPPRHAVQSLYNSPRLPRPRTVNYIANIYSRKLRTTRVQSFALVNSQESDRFRVRRFIPVLITTFERCTRAITALRSYIMILTFTTWVSALSVH